ncbi:hypothetical protein DB347_08860 [Opitutaceae bacterium EW11]|nr:hypothetical protein DB347_08860 [Opitutaceae bacterium EW11]
MTRKTSSAGAEPPSAAGAFGIDLPDLWKDLPADARQRLERVAEASPLYADQLRLHPEWALWLEEDRNLHSDFRYGAVRQEWAAFSGSAGIPAGDTAARLEYLRRWRRLMSLRVAYRSVNGLASEKTSVEELTRVAEFCVRECLDLAEKRWTERYGTPWDEVLQRSARFCIVALGKLGGAELNFSSDIDLLFFYDGEGVCRREGRPTPVSNVEYFTKIAETISASLSSQTSEGFLFRVDARLRPEGAFGPLVRSLTSLENYYAVAGQTWERLALLKARPIAGDLSLGFELLESLQSFRYPRNPPPSLLEEVSAMKRRTEQEVVGTESLENDVKSGTGGIREVEFVVQALQLMYAGRYPFLQTNSTDAALDQLVRYGLMPAEKADRLRKSYWWLRQLEHRLQVREERQTHCLPEDAAEREALARTLGYSDRAGFEEALRSIRAEVTATYAAHFPTDPSTTTVFDAWWVFFTSDTVPAAIAESLVRWFGSAENTADGLRRFVCGNPTHVVTREQVLRFEHLASSFDELMPALARPLETLNRLGRFAERYGSRNHFFSSCGDNPQLLRALALLFDRSTFVHELLCAHPEILEEIIRPEILRQRKDAASLRRELAHGPKDHAAYATWFPLYIRAEQVRYAAANLLGFATLEETEKAFTRLADAAIADVVRRNPSLERLLVVALGSYGGGELTFGADLDVIFVAEEADVSSLEGPLKEALRTLRGRDPLGTVLEMDARLRPHGEAGPLIATIASYQHYHDGGGAQFWERQLLVRSRVVSGPAKLREVWEAFVEKKAFRQAPGTAELREAWRMRGRIETERGAVEPRERAFKTAAGGRVDHEFLVQLLQMRHAGTWPSVQTANTRAAISELVCAGRLSPEAAAILRRNYEFLKELEMVVRLDVHTPVSVLPADWTKVARWLGYPAAEDFMADHAARLKETRRLVLNLLFPGDDQV